MILPAQEQVSTKQRLITGTIVAATGIAVALVAVGVIPADPDSINCPRWVLLLVGLLLACGGFAALAPPGTTISTVFVGLAVTMMATAFTWVAVWAPSEGISGGIPLLPASWNHALGRVAFGIGAVLVWLLAAVIWRSCFKTMAKGQASQQANKGGTACSG